MMPAYKKLAATGQIEITASPYYHPILPLLYNTKIAKEANVKTVLPKEQFAFPEDARAQIDLAVKFFHVAFRGQAARHVAFRGIGVRAYCAL